MFLQLAHTKTDVFHQSQNLALECYRITKVFPSDEKFAMVQQIRRAALSVYLNIAEGCSCKSLAERKHFFEISRGSVIEIDAAIEIAYKLNYCDVQMIETLGNLIISCFKQLTAMIGRSFQES
jgi:four helix bundle protein